MLLLLGVRPVYIWVHKGHEFVTMQINHFKVLPKVIFPSKAQCSRNDLSRTQLCTEAFVSSVILQYKVVMSSARSKIRPDFRIIQPNLIGRAEPSNLS